MTTADWQMSFSCSSGEVMDVFQMPYDHIQYKSTQTDSQMTPCLHANNVASLPRLCIDWGLVFVRSNQKHVRMFPSADRPDAVFFIGRIGRGVFTGLLALFTALIIIQHSVGVMLSWGQISSPLFKWNILSSPLMSLNGGETETGDMFCFLFLALRSLAFPLSRVVLRWCFLWLAQKKSSETKGMQFSITGCSSANVVVWAIFTDLPASQQKP